MKRLISAIAILLAMTASLHASDGNNHVIAHDRYCSVVMTGDGYFLTARCVDADTVIMFPLASDEYTYNFTIIDIYGRLNGSSPKSCIQFDRDGEVMTIWKVDSRTFYMAPCDVRTLNEMMNGTYSGNSRPRIFRGSMNVLRRACNLLNL